MKLNKAFALRVREILAEKNMTQYKLEELTGIYHSTMSYILNCKGCSCKFGTMAIIVKELGYSLKEFFDSPLFDYEKLDTD